MADEAVAQEKAKAPGRPWLVPLIVLMFALFIDWLDNLSFTPVLPLIQKAWDMNFTQLGFFTGLLGLTGLIISLPYGEFTKRVGTKTSALVGLGAVLVGMVIIAPATTFVQGVIGRALSTAGYRGAQVALFSGVAMVAPPRIMATLMGATFSLSNVAQLFGVPIIGGYIGATYGWQGVFWSMAAITAVAWVFILAFFRMPRAAPAPALPKPTATTLSGQEAVVRGTPVGAGGATVKAANPYLSGSVWMLAFVFALSVAGVVSVLFFSPSVMARVFGLSTLDIAFTFTAAQVLGIPLAILGGVASDRLKTRKWVIIAFVAPIIPLSLLLNTNDPTFFRIVAAVMIGLVTAPASIIYATPPEVYPGRDLGPVYGVMTMGASGATFFVPQILGVLRDVTGGFTVGWYFLSAVSLLAVLVTWRLKIR